MSLCRTLLAEVSELKSGPGRSGSDRTGASRATVRTGRRRVLKEGWTRGTLDPFVNRVEGIVHSLSVSVANEPVALMETSGSVIWSCLCQRSQRGRHSILRPRGSGVEGTRTYISGGSSFSHSSPRQSACSSTVSLTVHNPRREPGTSVRRTRP